MSDAGASSQTGEMTVRVSKTKFWYWLLGYPAWRKKTWTATESGLVARSGILSRNETRIPWARITDKRINQSVFGRMFNYGRIELDSAGETGSMVLAKVGNVEKFYDVICQRTDAAAMREGT